MIEWKPIENVPKDGRWFIVCDKNYYPESLEVANYDLVSEGFLGRRDYYDFNDLKRYYTHYAEIGEGP